MNVLTADFHSKTIRYAFVSENGVLFNTIDICRILRILKRPANGALSRSCLNMKEIIRTALTDGRKNVELVEWLETNFIGYEIETPVEPSCDDDWQIKDNKKNSF